VADDVDARQVQRGQQVGGDLREVGQRIGADLGRPRAGGVAQLVGRIGAQFRLGEQRRDGGPLQRRLREAVQQQHRPAVVRTVDPHVEGQVADIGLQQLTGHGPTLAARSGERARRYGREP
jgi:hypothetical protein